MKFQCDRTCPLYERIDTCRFNPMLAAIGPVEVNSHVIDVEVEIRDLDALDSACKELGLHFEKGRTTYKWYGTHVGDYPLPKGFTADQMGKCQHAIHRADGKGYGIGVCKVGKHYRLIFDFYGSDGKTLMDTIGRRAEKLTGTYAVKVAQKQCLKLGWKTQRTVKGLTVYHPSKGTLTISKAGDVEAHGFHGQGCHEATHAIAQVIGNVKTEAKKKAYNETVLKVKQKPL